MDRQYKGWFNQNAKYFNLKSMKRELNLPVGKLQRHAKNKVKINDKYINRIYSLMHKLSKFTLGLNICLHGFSFHLPKNILVT